MATLEETETVRSVCCRRPGAQACKASLKRGNVVLEELQTAQLATKLEDRHAAGAELEALGESIDRCASHHHRDGAGRRRRQLTASSRFAFEIPTASYVLSMRSPNRASTPHARR